MMRLRKGHQKVKAMMTDQEERLSLRKLFAICFQKWARYSLHASKIKALLLIFFRQKEYKKTKQILVKWQQFVLAKQRVRNSLLKFQRIACKLSYRSSFRLWKHYMVSKEK